MYRIEISAWGRGETPGSSLLPCPSVGSNQRRSLGTLPGGWKWKESVPTLPLEETVLRKAQGGCRGRRPEGSVGILVPPSATGRTSRCRAPSSSSKDSSIQALASFRAFTWTFIMLCMYEKSKTLAVNFTNISVCRVPGWLSRLSVSSSHDLMVCEFEPHVRLCARSLEPASSSASPFLCAPPSCSVSLKNK